MLRFYCLSQPSDEPVSVSLCKSAARFDGSAIDSLISLWIVSARRHAEHETGRMLGEQTWRAEFSDWPSSDDLIRATPLRSAVVSYWNGAGYSTLDPSQYFPLDHGSGVSIIPAVGSSWPAMPEYAGPRVRIDVTCGYDEDAQEMAAMRTYIMAEVATQIRRPESVADKPLEFTPQFASLLDPYRVWA